MSTVEPVRVALERPDQTEVLALVAALDAYQKPLYPPESYHGIDGEALRDPSVLFAVARDAKGAAVGCGAARLLPGYAELKRMYTPPEQRGRGIGAAILRFVEDAARARGLTHLALETGHLQHEALRLYERHGYTRSAPFGDYAPDPHSVFMQKTVAPVKNAREVSIWRATPQDVADVAPLFDGYREFYGRDPDPGLAASFLAERLARRESIVLLARDGNGAARGFVQLYPTFSSVRAARVLILNDLFVARQARRKGVGHALLDAAARTAKEEGAARLKLFTAINNTPAQRLYESLGWIRDTEFYEYNLSVP